MRITLLLIHLLFISSTALANSTSSNKEDSEQSSFNKLSTTPEIIYYNEYINEDDYSHAEDFEGIRINTLENGNLSFNYCSYERVDEKNIIKDCSLYIGSPEGYSKSIAEQKLFDYSTEREYKMSTFSALSAVVIIIGILRFRAIEVRQRKLFQSRKNFSSILDEDHFKAMDSDHVKNLALMFGVVFAGKIWLVDNAGEQEDLVKDAYEKNPMNTSFVLIEDFNPKKLANKLSRSLKDN